MKGFRRLILTAFLTFIVAGNSPAQPLQLTGDLIANLQSVDLNAASTWSNRTVNINSVGDFTAVGGSVLNVVSLPYGAGNVNSLFVNGDGTQAVRSALQVPTKILGQGTVSVEAWVYAVDVGSQAAPITSATVAYGVSSAEHQRDFNYAIGNGNGAVSGYADDSNWTPQTFPTPGVWHYLVYTYDGTTFRAYEDGDINTIVDKPGWNTESGVLSVGSDGITGGGDPFHGYIAAARVMSGVLTDDQIQNNFAAGLLGTYNIVANAPLVSPTNAAFLGDTVTFTELAQGAPPLTYQWYTDNGNGGASFSLISGQTGTNYTLNTTALGKTGTFQYEVVVTSGASSATSAPAILTVNAASKPILSQAVTPASTNAFVGSAVSFTGVFVGNQPITYGWQVSTNGGTTYSAIPGSSSNILNLTNLQLTNSGLYILLATNAFGTNGTAPATLTVQPSSALPQLQVAGQLLANLQSADLNLNSTIWTNEINGVGNFSTVGGGQLNVSNLTWNSQAISALFVNKVGNNSVQSSQLIPAGLSENGIASVEAWVFPTGDTGNSSAVAWGVQGGSSLPMQQREFNYNTGNNGAVSGDFGSYDTPWTGTLTTNAWHYLAWTYDGTSLVVYMDGVSNNIRTLTTPLDTQVTVMSVGSAIPNSGPNAGNDSFQGYVAGARVHTGVLTASQIQNNYIAGPLQKILIVLGTPIVSPSNTTYIGNLVTLSETNVQSLQTLTYQWQTDNGSSGTTWTAISGATNTNYTFSTAGVGNFEYNLVASGTSKATSAPVTLTVLPDTAIPPAIVQAYNSGATNVVFVFSKQITTASATNVANYVFTNGLSVLGASLAADAITLTLTTSPLVNGSNYSVVINGVTDRSAPPILITTNTLVSFIASVYTPADIGGAAAASSFNIISNGLAVTAVGSDIGGTSDQFTFEYQPYVGDFDVKVDVSGLNATDVWAKAGLMARESTAIGSRFVATIATPGMNGCFFEWRSATGGASTNAGSFPANYPNTWLRLKRSGNVFSSFAGYDGVAWTQLGSLSLVVSNQLYLGFALSSHNTASSATAQFVGETNVVNAVTSTITNPHEPLGSSSRKTGIVFSEIMYKPAPRADGNDIEFIEIYNSNPFFQDISSYQITCADMSYTFPPNTIIPGGAFYVVAASPQGIQNVYGVTTNVFGPYNGSLKKTETLELLDEKGAVLLTVPYSNVYPWPTAAVGTGHSIVLANPSYGEGDPRAWDISDITGGSPGQGEAFRPSPLRSVLINEILPHSENPGVAPFVELYNHSNQTNDLSGSILTDDTGVNKFIIPAGTLVAPGGFVSFNQSQLGFALNPSGAAIYFIKPDNSRVLDSVQYAAQSDGVSYGRWPDGANDFYALNTRTPGARNSAILIGDIVINELMYKPISGNDDDQYIELYNKGTNTIDLSGWQFSGGITFTFPTNTLVASNSYVVMGRNLTNLFAKYPNLNSNNTVGNYSGKLSHGGERVALSMPQSLNGTSTIYVVEDEVTYGTGGRWPQWASGGGSSMELIDPRANHRLAANWADSDESQKSVWTNIEWTGVLDNGRNFDSTIDYAQIGILDVGECLVDNIEVDNSNAVNVVSNPTFETGTNGWSFQGCMARSSLENTGFSSAHSLHIRCSDRVWTGDNSCQVALNANSLASGQTATLRFKARWLHGWPEALLRVNGNWLEATGPMQVPTNLGTPGLPNSRYATNAGPAVYQVTHFPTLPAASQSVVVSARVHDPDGTQALTLFYRIDPATNYSAVVMKDDGTGGDAIANDGIFSATIPGQSSNVIAAFFISATDSRGAATRFPALANDNAPVRECLVLFGDANPAGSFGVYHLWVSQTNLTRWSNLSDLSNEGNDATFVNNSRVVYNMQGRFAGSPYHQEFNTPVGHACHYKWIFPDDDMFLGATDFNKIHEPGNSAGDDASIQREQLANTFLRALGVPWLYKRYAVVYVNGNRRGTLMEDTQVPGSDVVKEHWPDDSDGFLYKMQPWFEMAPFPVGPNITFSNNSWCDLLNFTTTGGVKKPSRYRYNFEIRRTPDSASDFTNVFSLIDAANSSGTPSYTANMQQIADMENWMRVFAANHAAGNWDSLGGSTGQNLYGYMGTFGTRYSLLMWDFNIVLGSSGSWGPGANLFVFNGQDANIAKIFANPPFLRMYWRALGELVNGPLDVNVSGPLLDAKFNSFAANGVTVENPNTSLKTWLSQAKASIASQLAAVNATSFTINPVVVSNDVAIVSGKAPVNAQTIWLNGIQYPVTWTGLTTWTAIVPLKTGTNFLNVTARDSHGQSIAGDTATTSAVYNQPATSPVGQIVINEVMYNPLVPGADYVELYNLSSNITFDLSGWQIDGLGYTFPAGSFIGPTNFLVLAANEPAYAAAYGATAPFFDLFTGTLQPPQTLSLIQPGVNGQSNVVVTKLRYDSALPWSTNANGTGSSLQLIDAHQDNWRVGNWAVVVTNPLPPTAQWVEVTATGTASSSTLYIYLGSAGDLYIDDIKLVAGSVADTGTNLLPDGGFESGFPTPWVVSTNLTGSGLSTTIKHSGTAALHVVSTSEGTTRASAIYQDITPALTANGTYTLSFWYLQSSNGGPLTVRLSNSGITSVVNPAIPSNAGSLTLATPGLSNSVAATLPAFAPLWINELQVSNLTGITNKAGQRTAWLELYNPTTNPVLLTNLYLANNYTNLTNWAFPAGASISPGQFKVVFADGQTALSSLSELHTSFVLSNASGSIALSRIFNGTPQVLDYVDYSNIPANYSYGSAPDGQSFVRQLFFASTPGGSNNATALPPASFIPYGVAGSVYSQDFNSLPNPGSASINTANPVIIGSATYSLANPFDFAAPAVPSGSVGGLGDAAMAGWYGLADPTASIGTRFGATDGDQTTGGDVSFGLPSDANRALGLLSTSTTGYTAFGAKFLNQTTGGLNYITLQLTAEVWRQSDKAKSLQFYYYVDPTGTNAFSTQATAFVPALNVAFPTVAADTGGVPVDGTSAANQSKLGVVNQAITNWPAGGALWLVWEMADSGGRAQGLAIDNLNFSASSQTRVVPVSLVSQLSQTNLIFNWQTLVGARYQIEFNNDLGSTNWLPMGTPISGTGSTIGSTNGITGAQRFFRIRMLTP